MTRHYPRSYYHHQHEGQQQGQERSKEKGWYCKEHDTKYLCGICGYNNVRKHEAKYYFVG